MKTLIFKSFGEFLNRTDWETNGVSEEFAKEHPDFEKQNETNNGCWDCSDCSGCSRCSDCWGCWRCSDCSGCWGCSDCSGCWGCWDCSDCSNLKNAAPEEKGASSEDVGFPKIPKIEGIHHQILKAVSAPGAFDMSTWHSCETTHCRAGWVVQLAGDDGRKLEAKTSTPFAAMQIYHASCPEIPVSPVRFYEDDKTAMADIERCAAEEKALKEKTAE